MVFFPSLKQTSCVKYIVGSCFYHQPDIHCLFIRMLRPFTLETIIDVFGYKYTLIVDFHFFFYQFFFSISFLPDFKLCVFLYGFISFFNLLVIPLFLVVLLVALSFIISLTYHRRYTNIMHFCLYYVNIMVMYFQFISPCFVFVIYFNLTWYKVPNYFHFCFRRVVKNKAKYLLYLLFMISGTICFFM